MKQAGAAMKSALALVSNGGVQVAETPERKAVEYQGALAEWFNEIFPEILMACPRWGLTISGDAMMRAAKRVWLQALADHGITKKSMVSRGIKALQDRGQEYLPSPAEFCGLCLEADGVPSVNEAFAEVRATAYSAKYRSKDQPAMEYSHPIIKHLAGKCSGLFFTGIGEKAAREAFGDEYRQAVEAFKRGDFDKPKDQQIEHQPMDASLAHYFMLLRDFSHIPEIAEGYIADCKLWGIHIDPENGTVTRDACLVDYARQKAVAA